MARDSWLHRQPAYVRYFLWSAGVAALAFLVLLLLVARGGPEWIPPVPLTDDTLVPASADSARRHYTPDTLTIRPLASISATATPLPYTLRWRTGVALPDGEALCFAWPQVRPAWYLNWSANVRRKADLWGLLPGLEMALPDPQLGMEFTPMVSVSGGRLFPDAAALRDLAARYRGLTWLIGNEPDVKWQSNAPPEVYAIAYHRAYTAIKAGDSSAKVAIGGISQVTPLRLAYLDRVWAFYRSLYGREMPVDVWNMHAFVLREERGSWGVNMPPGFSIEQRGMLWDVEDHDDLALVEEQVRAMRRWMAAHGQQEKPLWITEYGILMPEEYGFDADRVTRFMLASFDLFATLADPALGYPPDGGRLVQRWMWYPARDSRYSAGNLFDDYGRVTAVGDAFFGYLAAGEEQEGGDLKE